jgi:hypothetical protein
MYLFDREPRFRWAHAFLRYARFGSTAPEWLQLSGSALFCDSLECSLLRHLRLSATNPRCLKPYLISEPDLHGVLLSFEWHNGAALAA